jgi:hypothetical protein
MSNDMAKERYLCPFCPAVFSSDVDLQLHLKAFGRNVKTHLFNIKRARERAEREQRFKMV